ncbi:MAG: ATP-binding cassette domain-containing protein [Tractidigestivibacter scatoligenes]
MLYVPQEIGVDAARRACARLQGLAAGEKGQVLSVVAQLNSRPDALLEEGELSPGELRKLVLAEAVLTKPQLLVMDEPTNHLDLHSIEALERLLSDFPGAVVLVSHDARVVRSSCGRIWELLPASGDDFTSGAVVVER